MPILQRTGLDPGTIFEPEGYSDRFSRAAARRPDMFQRYVCRAFSRILLISAFASLKVCFMRHQSTFGCLDEINTTVVYRYHYYCFPLCT